MFVDIARVFVKAGDGGDGAVSFHREKYVAAGGPDGGDGGKGGDIVFVADSNMSNLIDFKYKRKFVAEKGENGSKKRCYGKNAPDLIVKVPVGTVVYDDDTGRILADISDDTPQVIAVGGKGGKGNAHFATSTRQIPKFAKPGFKGDSYNLRLELKLIADVGLVGFPNVGKSTLISVVSAAKPKIANYHFTTLTPVLGVVKTNDTSFVMADIPGLIEGASEGVGLGHEFLRHVERCRLIVHVVDVSGSEGRDPKEDYETICRELENFNEELCQVPMLVAANKSDMATSEQLDDFKQFIEQKGLDVVTISAATTSGTDELVNKISQMLAALPPVKRYEAQPLTREELDEKLLTNKDFSVTVEDGVYFVEADWLYDILRVVNMDDYSSLQYFQRVLQTSGIIDKLEQMGINEGDTVAIFDFEFEYMR
ncbi:MAG: GTPase ObgE [Ruminococcus sp.]|nr:GTPase ObgE [Ruminococcus sp.]